MSVQHEHPIINGVMLSLRHLSKRFGSTVAVDDLSFEADAGEILGLLGPNGAGKTTTIRMIAGLLRPDAGEIEIDGAGSPDRPRVRRRIGVAPQAQAIYAELTGAENRRVFGRLAGLSGKLLRKRVDWSLDFVALSDRKDDRVNTYSGGMKRRLNLAAALVHDPPLLLLDEPTVGVDAQSRNAMFERILELKSLGRTVIYTTHYIEEAQRLCERVGIIDHGRFLALDTVEKLIETYGGQSVVTATRREGEVRIETEDPLGECVKLQQNGGILSLRVDRPDLQRVFLNLTGKALRD
ncbi:MAG: ABC transporter ATP-binding protein [Phycisphaerae bacterium]